MALIATRTLTANGTVSVKCKNSRNGNEATYTAIAFGNFGGGTITPQVSANAGVTFVNKIDNGASIAFTEGFGEEFKINSDENDPVFLGFTLTDSTTPSITIKIYDGK